MMKEEKTLKFNNNKVNNQFYDLQYFVKLDSENKICFDCGGPFPTYVSINNGVFICSNCARNHEKLGYNISYVHQISSSWDPYLLGYATRGGNTRFKNLCLQYEVPCQSFSENDEEKLNKYIIRLGEYHRLVLRSEILADEPPQPLYFEVAKNPCNLNIIYFPEFQNYQLYKGDIALPNKNSSIGGKIWNGTKATAGVIGTAGGLAYKVGKPVVCFLGKTAFKGLKYVGGSIINHNTNSDNNKNINNNTPTNNFKNNNNNNYNYNNNYNKFNNSNGNKIMNDFALVDYSDEDLCQIKTVDLNSPKDKGNNNISYNININNNYNNYNNDYNNNQNMKNVIKNNQYGNLNKHNNIIVNDDYLMNNGNNMIININKSNNTPLSNNINSFQNTFGEFEIISRDNDNDYNNSSNSLFENNSFAGMDVQFENTDKEKARKDANNFLLKP